MCSNLRLHSGSGRFSVGSQKKLTRQLLFVVVPAGPWLPLFGILSENVVIERTGRWLWTSDEGGNHHPVCETSSLSGWTADIEQHTTSAGASRRCHLMVPTWYSRFTRHWALEFAGMFSGFRTKMHVHSWNGCWSLGFIRWWHQHSSQTRCLRAEQHSRFQHRFEIAPENCQQCCHAGFCQASHPHSWQWWLKFCPWHGAARDLKDARCFGLDTAKPVVARWSCCLTWLQGWSCLSPFARGERWPPGSVEHFLGVLLFPGISWQHVPPHWPTRRQQLQSHIWMLVCSVSCEMFSKASLSMWAVWQSKSPHCRIAVSLALENSQNECHESSQGQDESSAIHCLHCSWKTVREDCQFGRCQSFSAWGHFCNAFGTAMSSLSVKQLVAPIWNTLLTWQWNHMKGMLCGPQAATQCSTLQLRAETGAMPKSEKMSSRSVSVFLQLWWLALGVGKVVGGNFHVQANLGKIALTMIRNSRFTSHCYDATLAKKCLDEGLTPSKVRAAFEQTVQVVFFEPPKQETGAKKIRKKEVQRTVQCSERGSVMKQSPLRPTTRTRSVLCFSKDNFCSPSCQERSWKNPKINVNLILIKEFSFYTWINNVIQTMFQECYHYPLL